MGLLDRIRLKREPSGYDLFVEDITRLNGKLYYSLDDDDRQIANYMLDRGYMHYNMEKGKPRLYITRLGYDMMRDGW